MRTICLVLLLLSAPVVANDAGQINCGMETVRQMMQEKWHILRVDYLSQVSADELRLQGGSIFKADNTIGMLRGDQAILLSKYVPSTKTSGYIYTICAGGFDAWVTPIK